MYKKLIAFLLLVLFVCCGCAKKQETVSTDTLEQINQRGKIIVGVKTDAFPFGYIDAKGHYAGYDVTLGRLIAKGLLGDEKKVNFVSVTPSDRMLKLYSGDIDMLIATMSVTPKRQEILDFSNSYYTAGQALLVRNGSSINSIKDLNGKKAIIVFGSTAENSIRKVVPNLGIIGYRTYPEAYKALKARKADAIMGDDSILMGFSINDKSVVLRPKRYSKEPYAIAFKKGSESTSLINAVNNIIEIETKNGNLKKIRKSFGIN
jgi:putative glutamine transport system substrate-binding protein